MPTRVVDNGSGVMVRGFHTLTGDLMNPIMTNDVESWKAQEHGLERIVLINSDSFAPKVFAVMFLQKLRFPCAYLGIL